MSARHIVRVRGRALTDAEVELVFEAMERFVEEKRKAFADYTQMCAEGNTVVLALPKFTESDFGIPQLVEIIKLLDDAELIVAGEEA